jgi:hypothetical protein
VWWLGIRMIEVELGAVLWGFLREKLAILVMLFFLTKIRLVALEI